MAERYLEAFRRTHELLCREPNIGVLRRFRSPRLRGIRSFQLHGAFRVHLVFYRVDAEVLVIFRVLHGMRDLPRRLLQPPAADD
ncbi:MAG: type II toxin-antitoxin system RelE/ParE family toxin [Verrucomicrobiaceae bacterium]|nr:type II toxin-antitoxin system RelE/ParE family toxin [Verrucomicrobiaceae bacterium]